MDATRNKRIFIPVPWLLIALILAATFMLGRCSAPVAAQSQETQVPLTLDASLVLGNDGTGEAHAAIAEAFRNLVTTTTSPPSAAAQQVDPPAPVTPSGDRWDQLAACETGGNWATNSGNGYGGGLQFAHTASWSTWISYGGAAYAPNPWDASREEQIAVAENVLASSGWRAWPGCARKNGWL